ncbi:MAG: nucleotidyltransferase domain-containing protein [Desulfohalobiaceae bacterium]
MVNESIIDSIRKYVEEASKSGLHISEAVLFGSHARGEADQESDLDVLIVCAEYQESSSERIKDLLWALRTKTDSRIEPVPISEKDWLSGAGGIIADIARKEGIRIPGQINMVKSGEKRPH